METSPLKDPVVAVILPTIVIFPSIFCWDAFDTIASATRKSSKI